MWEALGFTARAAAVGRGKDHSPMTVWWLDNGHPDLFTLLVEPELLEDDEPDLLEAALDVNILIDLHTHRDRPGAERSHVLEADHLVGRLRLVVTDGLDHDIARHPEEQRTRLGEAAAHYPRRAAPVGHAEALFAQLEAAVVGPLSEQDKGDLWQIAGAVAAGVGVLLTWDDGLRARFARLREAVPALSAFRVYEPDHVVTHLDELARGWAYQPARLHGSDYDQVLAGADHEPDLMSFLDRSRGERRNELRDVLRRLAREQVPRWLIRSGAEPPLACYATHLDGEILRVPLLRLAHQALADTLARQLLWMLRHDARAEGACVIDISDPHLSSAFVRFGASDAFQRNGDHWYGLVVPVCGIGQQVTEAANHARDLANLGSGSLIRSHLAPRAAAEIERALWPAKLTDSDLPHFVLPIQPRWSSGLLGYPVQLTSRRTELALGREQVYYRTADSQLTAPARILWRISKDPHNTAEIVATSLLDDIQVDTPAQLHTALSRYGVMDLHDLENQANNRPVLQAVRFSETELFRTPITKNRYNSIRQTVEGPSTFPGPRRITADLFQAIYEAATGRSDTSHS